jgi:hypothetical protein
MKNQQIAMVTAGILAAVMLASFSGSAYAASSQSNALFGATGGAALQSASAAAPGTTSASAGGIGPVFGIFALGTSSSSADGSSISFSAGGGFADCSSATSIGGSCAVSAR